MFEEPLALETTTSVWQMSSAAGLVSPLPPLTPSRPVSAVIAAADSQSVFAAE